MKKRILAVVMSIAMLMNTNGLAYAAQNMDNTSQGSGIIRISSEKDLKKIADDLSGHYVLTNSITLKKEWNPIGDKDTPFTGTLDGDGHAIRGMKVSVQDNEKSVYGGLFGVAEDADIEQLALEDISIQNGTGSDAYMGGIAGKMTNTSISDCYVSGNISTGTAMTQTTGGIAGAVYQDGDSAYDSSISTSFARVDISNPERGVAGAIAGWLSESECVQNCYTDNDRLELFTAKENPENCRALVGDALAREVNYAGFDFQNVWAITDKGPKLISQLADDEKSSYIENFTYQDDKAAASEEVSSTETTEEEQPNQKEEQAATKKEEEKNTKEEKKNTKQVSSENTTEKEAVAVLSDTTSGDFTYSVTGTEAAITGYTGSGGNVVVPDTIDGYKITGIGSSAFANNTLITSVTLGKNIKEIRNNAFSSCTNLESVTMSYNSTVEYTASIGASVFLDCTSLAKVSLSENVTSIGDCAFSGCSALESLILPESLTSMGSRMIEGTAISSITIPKNVSACGSSSYNGPLANSKVLTTVIFEDGMTAIPSYILASDYYTSYVTNVQIPDTVTSIGNSAFYKCSNLEKITLPQKLKKIGQIAFSGCASINEVFLGKNITEIGSSAFASCTNLESVTMSYNSTVEYTASIGDSVFIDCTSLAKVSLSENVASIGNCTFSGCSALESLILPESLTSMGSRMIEGTAISSITIPKNVSSCSSTYSTDNGPLANSKVLTTVIFEEGMTAIPSYILESDDYNSYVTNVQIPDTVTSIGESAFYKCSRLEKITLPQKLTVIERDAFSGCTSIKGVSLGKNITEIGSSAFASCTNLESVTMSYNSTVEYTASIGSNAFYGCMSLAKVSLSENVTSIGNYAFSGCSALESLILPESLTSMGSRMIEGTAISSITIPKNVSSCSSTYSTDNGPLANSKVLTTVIFEEGMTAIPSYILASDDYTSYVSKVIIPASVRSIGDYAFYKCNNMTIYGYINSYAQQYAESNEIPFVSVAIAKNATADDVMSHINLGDLISDVSLENTTIYGPSVTIDGNTFSLFQFNAGATLKLNDKVQAKVDMDKKTVQVLIGFDKFSGSATLGKDVNSDNYWKESYAQVKSLYKGVVGEKASTDQLYHNFQKLRGKLRKTDCSIGIKASAEVAGYAEFSFASGELEYTSGGLVLSASLGYEEEQRIPCFPAAYVVFGLNASFNGKLTLERTKDMEFKPGMDASIGLEAKLGVGAGSKKLSTYAELGLKGKVEVGVKLPAASIRNALKASLSATVYLDSKIFGFKGPSYQNEFAKVQIYPRSSTASLSSIDLDTYDWDKAEPMSRDYLTNGMAVLSSADTADTDTLYSAENAYPYNNAKLARLDDGTYIMFWVDDTGNKSDVNRTTLMYSVYDGEKWNSAAVDETGGSDDYPCVYSDGSRALVVWQKAAKMEENAGLPDLLKTVELYCAVYENGKLSSPEKITAGNTAYEMMQTAAVNGSDTAVAWVENSENNPFQSAGSNSVKMAVKNNGGWDVQTIASDAGLVKNMSLEYISSKPVLTYETGNDNDESTIHCKTDSGVVTFAGHAAQIAGGMMYYSDSESIKSYDIATGYKETLGLPAMNDFVVLDNGTTKAVYSTEYSGYTSELIMYPYERVSGEWGDKVTLTDYGKYIRSYSVVQDKAGNATVSMNLVDVNEDADEIYGDSRMVVVDQTDYIDLELQDNITYNEKLVSPGARLPISFEVRNNSAKEVKNYTASLLAEDGTTLATQTVNCDISAGQSAGAQLVYQLPEDLTYQTVSLRVDADNDRNADNNMQQFGIGYADLAVDSIYMSGTGTKPVLRGTVGNHGYKDAANVKVKLYYGDAETAFATCDQGTVAAGGSSEFSADIPAEYMPSNPMVAGNVIRVEVESDEPELIYDNNEDQLIIQPEEDAKIYLNKKNLTLVKGQEETLSVSYSYNSSSDRKTEWTSSNEQVAEVTDGIVKAVGAGTATIKASVGASTAECTVTVVDSTKVEVQDVSLDVMTVKLKAGGTQILKASVLPEGAENTGFVWSSDNEGVATVSKNGEVKAVAAGKAVITATAADGYHSAQCTVTVTPDENAEYTVSFAGGDGTMGMRPSSLSGVGGSVVTLPENPYTKEGYTFAGWSDGVSVYKAGETFKIPYHNVKLTAEWIEKGSAEYYISVRADGNGHVTPGEKVTVKEGKSQTFEIVPEEGYEIESVYVDNENVGSVSSYTFEKVNSDHDIHVVFVKKKDTENVPVEAITITGVRSENYVGSTLFLRAEIQPDNATVKDVEWSVSNEKIARIEGGILELLKCGRVTVKAKACDGSGVTGELTIDIMGEPIIITGDTTYNKTYGDPAFYLNAQVIKGDGEVTYTSSDPDVAAVNHSGKVVIKKAGKAVITMKVIPEAGNQNMVEFSMLVNISKADQELKGTSNYNKKLSDGAFVLDTEQKTGDGNLSYKSSDNSVATVNSSGKVFIKGVGSAVITVTAEETDCYKEAVKNVTVTVSKPAQKDLAAKSAKTAVTGVKDATYTGKAITMSSLKVTAYGVTLTSGKDYTVSYKNNKNAGTATITVTGKNGYKGTVKKTFNISIPKGRIYESGGLKYKVTSSAAKGSGTVTLTGTTYKTSNRKFKTLTVKNTVSIGGKTFKVTAIGRNAFKGYKYLAKAAIGANVQTIGAGAFSGCSGLKSITISTAKLTSKSVGANAFARIYAKANVKVPAKQLTAYKKLLKQKGLPAKAVVKK